MCQDVPRLQLFFHHSYSSFAFLLENVKRSKLRTSCLAPQQWQCQISVFWCSPHSLMFRPSTDCALLLPAYLPGPFNALSTEIGTFTPWTCCVSSAKTLQKLRILILKKRVKTYQTLSNRCGRVVLKKHGATGTFAAAAALPALVFSASAYFLIFARVSCGPAVPSLWKLWKDQVVTVMTVIHPGRLPYQMLHLCDL